MSPPAQSGVEGGGGGEGVLSYNKLKEDRDILHGKLLVIINCLRKAFDRLGLKDQYGLNEGQKHPSIWIGEAVDDIERLQKQVRDLEAQLATPVAATVQPAAPVPAPGSHDNTNNATLDLQQSYNDLLALLHNAAQQMGFQFADAQSLISALTYQATQVPKLQAQIQQLTANPNSHQNQSVSYPQGSLSDALDTITRLEREKADYLVTWTAIEDTVKKLGAEHQFQDPKSFLEHFAAVALQVPGLKENLKESGRNASKVENELSECKTRAEIAENRALTWEARAKAAENKLSALKTRATTAEEQIQGAKSSATSALRQVELSDTRAAIAEAQCDEFKREAEDTQSLATQLRESCDALKEANAAQKATIADITYNYNKVLKSHRILEASSINHKNRWTMLAKKLPNTRKSPGVPSRKPSSVCEDIISYIEALRDENKTLVASNNDFQVSISKMEKEVNEQMENQATEFWEVCEKMKVRFDAQNTEIEKLEYLKLGTHTVLGALGLALSKTDCSAGREKFRRALNYENPDYQLIVELISQMSEKAQVADRLPTGMEISTKSEVEKEQVLACQASISNLENEISILEEESQIKARSLEHQITQLREYLQLSNRATSLAVQKIERLESERNHLRSLIAFSEMDSRQIQDTMRHAHQQELDMHVQVLSEMVDTFMADSPVGWSAPTPLTGNQRWAATGGERPGKIGPNGRPHQLFREDWDCFFDMKYNGRSLQEEIQEPWLSHKERRSRWEKAIERKAFMMSASLRTVSNLCSKGLLQWPKDGLLTLMSIVHAEVISFRPREATYSNTHPTLCTDKEFRARTTSQYVYPHWPWTLHPCRLQ